MEVLANTRLLSQDVIPKVSAGICRSMPRFNLDLAGLLVLADLQTVAKRTALTGTSAWLDVFVLAPGLHKQTAAPDLCKGEYPACAAMTTGYVFRVENPATVYYLQSVSRPGHLTTLSVGPAEDGTLRLTVSYLGHTAAIFLTVFVLAYLIIIEDFFGVTAVAILIAVRFINTIVIRRRARPGWFGAPEPGIQSDLLVLLSQDRWVRIQGATDDVKAITSGTWLAECTPTENSMLALGTLLTYLSVVITANASSGGQALLMALLLTNSALLGLANETSKALFMHGRQVEVKQGPKRYDRRLTLAKELIAEFGRADCFVGMGMIQPHQAEELTKSYKGAVTM